MNSSTLRRLAADHAALHRSELPPYWLFPASSTGNSIPDDLTCLEVLLAGPPGTPYTQGLWKVALKLPYDYPNSPPKAFFKTRIWHPNVEENTGSVCVDTLKRDWTSSLTFRDVLITLACLLIQPNPDSALNSTAGHLLQDDYNAFARQARLMTSIHASIPREAEAAVLAAQRRGDVSGNDSTKTVEDLSKDVSIKTSSVIMKNRNTMTTEQHVVPIHTTPITSNTPVYGTKGHDELSTSRENDLTPSLIHLSTSDVNANVSKKRPMPEESCPTKVDVHDTDQVTIVKEPTRSSCMRPGNTSQVEPTPEERTAQLVESTSKVNISFTGGSAGSRPSFESSSLAFDEENGRAGKRVCSDETKAAAMTSGSGMVPITTTTTTMTMPMTVGPITSSARIADSTREPASMPSTKSISTQRPTRPRVGLRRL